MALRNSKKTEPVAVLKIKVMVDVIDVGVSLLY